MSALLWRCKPYLQLEAIRQRSDVQLVSSAALLGELADVLTRSSATKRLALTSKTAREVLADYAEIVELVEPTSVPRVVCPAMPMTIRSSPLRSPPVRR